MAEYTFPCVPHRDSKWNSKFDMYETKFGGCGFSHEAPTSLNNEIIVFDAVFKSKTQAEVLEMQQFLRARNVNREWFWMQRPEMDYPEQWKCLTFDGSYPNSRMDFNATFTRYYGL
jgi:phage-related protein